MDLAEYARIAEAEDRHWWYRGTRAMIAQVLAGRLVSGMRILDAGCGPGGNSAWLLDDHEVVGLDTSAEALRLARLRHPGMELHLGDVTDLPFRDESFDLVLIITVMALVEDDARAIGELTRVLRPGGTIFWIEPANPWLRRDHDVVTHARRRYRLGDLKRLSDEAGLTVRRGTYVYSFLLPVAIILAAWHRIKPQRRADLSDLQRDRLGGLFGRLAALERKELLRRDLPFGLSAVVVAERPVDRV